MNPYASGARLSCKSTTIRRKTRSRLRTSFEQLEDRSMMSATPADLANMLAHCAEHYADIVTADYQHYLGRGADAQGLQNWVTLMQYGMTQEQLEAQFIGAPEYIANHGGAGAGWVTGMYNDLLGRSADSQGQDHWVQTLQSGADPASVALGFAASREREGQHVADDYTKLLGRSPGSAEVNAWVDDFAAGATNDDIITGFVGSPEFYHAHGGNKDDYVDAAFTAVLGRNPDPATDHSWLEAMKTTFEADLTGSTAASGSAEFDMQGSSDMFDVEIKGAPANAALNVTVNGVLVGQIVADATGSGELCYSSDPASGEDPFPAGFPPIQDGTVVAVGSLLQGSLSAVVDG